LYFQLDNDYFFNFEQGPDIIVSIGVA